MVCWKSGRIDPLAHSFENLDGLGGILADRGRRLRIADLRLDAQILGTDGDWLLWVLNLRHDFDSTLGRKQLIEREVGFLDRLGGKFLVETVRTDDSEGAVITATDMTDKPIFRFFGVHRTDHFRTDESLVFQHLVMQKIVNPIRTQL